MRKGENLPGRNSFEPGFSGDASAGLSDAIWMAMIIGIVTANLGFFGSASHRFKMDRFKAAAASGGRCFFIRKRFFAGPSRDGIESASGVEEAAPRFCPMVAMDTSNG